MKRVAIGKWGGVDREGWWARILRALAVMAAYFAEVANREIGVPGGAAQVGRCYCSVSIIL
jgi:hypothetical protein